MVVVLAIGLWTAAIAFTAYPRPGAEVGRPRDRRCRDRKHPVNSDVELRGLSGSIGDFDCWSADGLQRAASPS